MNANNDKSNSVVYKVTKATPDDAADILILQKVAFREVSDRYSWTALPPMVQTLDEMLWEFERYDFYKVVVNDVIVASVRAQEVSESLRISRLAVHPDHQKRGIGRTLMEAMEKWHPEFSRLELFTGQRSGKALGLFRSMGYQVFRFERLNEKLTRLWMEKHREVPAVQPELLAESEDQEELQDVLQSA